MNVKLKAIVFSVFLAVFALGHYGAQVLQRGEDDFASYTHQSLFQDIAMWAAIPGSTVMTIIMNPTDIPERDPNPMSIQWFTACVGGVFWTSLVMAFFYGCRRLKKRPNYNRLD